MPWTFYLNMTNGTPRTLELVQQHLSWGYWYRGDEDDAAPISIAPNQTLQVLGVRAASGSATGYECTAVWADVVPGGEKAFGTIDFGIDVPYSKSNSSRMHWIAPLKVDGWSDIPSSGHNFVRSVTVSVEGGALVARDTTATPATGDGTSAKTQNAGADGGVTQESDGAAGKKPVNDEDDRRHAAWLAAFDAANPDLRNYEEVLTLPEVQSFNVIENLPKVPELPPTRVLLARTKPLTIPHSEWSGFADPIFTTRYSRDIFVKDYVALAVHAINCNPRDVISLAPGETYTYRKRTEVTLFIRTLETNTWSLKTALSAEGTNPTQTAKVAASIESTFGVEKVLEDSTNRVVEEVLEETFKAPDDHGQLIVPYVFSMIALIYRIRKDPAVPPELMAVSEWARFQIETAFNV
ncbi:MAG TPA: hypothetical protein VFN10_03125 [Thermoanaerobaculia bacterium]|nr:hypothetical protein [Thermoanaerobaculia bacterium]